MKKQIRKRLSLHRETLRGLEEENLGEAVGGVSANTGCRSNCGSCPASACAPTRCPNTVCTR
jgi:hypothetical protein